VEEGGGVGGCLLWVGVAVITVIAVIAVIAVPVVEGDGLGQCLGGHPGELVPGDGGAVARKHGLDEVFQLREGEGVVPPRDVGEAEFGGWRMRTQRGYGGEELGRSKSCCLTRDIHHPV
jgi:hypothetical protein